MRKRHSRNRIELKPNLGELEERMEASEGDAVTSHDFLYWHLELGTRGELI